jgi:hypothetical protein
MVDTLYMAHNFESRKVIRPWELRIEGKYNINIANPFYDSDRSDIKTLDQLKDGSKAQRDFLGNRDDNLIVDGDLELIRKSDGIIAYVNARSFGTPMEIFFAARILQIPVYVITKRYAYHPWIKKYATRIFPTRRAFEGFIKKKYGVRS